MWGGVRLTRRIDCLCFLKAHTRIADLLCMMTGAKHRVRSTRGARGSNPSQKTPRQRGEFIPSRTKCALSTRFALCAKRVEGAYAPARGALFAGGQSPPTPPRVLRTRSFTPVVLSTPVFSARYFPLQPA